MPCVSVNRTKTISFIQTGHHYTCEEYLRRLYDGMSVSAKKYLLEKNEEELDEKKLTGTDIDEHVQLLGEKLKEIEMKIEPTSTVWAKDCLIMGMMDCAMAEYLCEYMNKVTHLRHFETSLFLLLFPSGIR